MHVVAAKAVAFLQAMSPEFRADAQRTVDNARALGEALAERGASLVSGGTDTHLLLVDVTAFGVTGKEADQALGEVDITVNNNAIPYDPNPPMVASGVGLGPPASPDGDGHRRDGRHRGAPGGRNRGPWRPRGAGRRSSAGRGPGRAIPGARIGWTRV
jgi:hypothetical protein